METSDREQTLRALKQRQGAIAEAWYQAVGDAACASLPVEQVRGRLAGLVQEVISLFLAESLDGDRAEQVGAALVDLHLIQAETLGRTIEVLGRELMAGLSADEAAGHQARLAALLGAVAAGYVRQARDTTLAEQEGMRNALVGELRAAERQLRQTQDELEMRVRERTVELWQSEEKYRRLLVSLHDGVYTVDREGRFTFVNEAITRRTGRPEEALLGCSFFDLVRPEDLPRMRTYFEALLRGEEVPAFELAYPNAQGDMTWVETNTSALWAGGEVVGMHGVSRDITQRKRAEQALQESEERWRSLVEYAPDLVVTLDRLARILYINHVPDTWPETVEDVIGMDALSYALPEYRPALREAIDAAFEGEEGGYLELVASGALGVPAWQAVRVGPVWREGQVASVMLIARDISEQKEIQQMKDDLIRDVSHELRNPLAKVRMSLDMLEEIVASEQLDRQRAARVGKLAQRNVDRLLRTLEGILDLSRLEAGVWARREQAVALEELVEEVVQYMAPLAASKNLGVGIKVGEDPLPTVTGDREGLFRVLLNLVDNAIKFTDEGQVVIAARAGDGLVEVSVADTGQGIEPHLLEQVFDRFYQEKAQAEGVGLGLTICKAVVEAHGGRIWVESPGKGQGSTFRFTLPVEMEGGGA